MYLSFKISLRSNFTNFSCNFNAFFFKLTLTRIEFLMSIKENWNGWKLFSFCWRERNVTIKGIVMTLPDICVRWRWFYWQLHLTNVTNNINQFFSLIPILDLKCISNYRTLFVLCWKTSLQMFQIILIMLWGERVECTYFIW